MFFACMLFMFIVNLPIIFLNILLASIILLLGKYTKDKRTYRYGYNLLISIDQYTNTILGGDEDETISSRTEKARLKKHKWAIILSKFLDLFEKDHTKKSLEKEEGKNQILKN